MSPLYVDATHARPSHGCAYVTACASARGCGAGPLCRLPAAASAPASWLLLVHLLQQQLLQL